MRILNFKKTELEHVQIWSHTSSWCWSWRFIRQLDLWPFGTLWTHWDHWRSHGACFNLLVPFYHRIQYYRNFSYVQVRNFAILLHCIVVKLWNISAIYRRCNLPKRDYCQPEKKRKNNDTVDSFLEKFSNGVPSQFFPIFSLLCTILVFSIRYCVDSFRRLVYICT